ncbi:MAG: flagellar basal body-associated FliL family protein [Solirubrobacteraceae bacterium]|nr:flagellar basal body-associated FliL family protein [Solirubrobacteraceae bacterium]
MKSFVTLIVVFVGAIGALWYLDREEKLPKMVAGTPTASAKKPPPAHWYTLAEPFHVNLRGYETVRMTVALQLRKPLPRFVKRGAAEGQLEQEAVIRDIVTDTTTNQDPAALRTVAGRRRLEELLERRIKAHTDVNPRRVLLPDVIVS